MATFKEKCWNCGKQCLNVEFCGDGATYDAGDSNGLSLPRNIKVKVVANSGFWGFGGTLIEGYAHFDNGHYDFFDGFDEDHKSLKTCNAITVGPYLNEQRPDTLYRSVFDPDDFSVVHYGADGTEDGVERGGAEVYLVDRPKALISSVSTDNSSCDATNPTQVFRKFPENYGLGNKIYFDNGIYKNATGAWRLYDNTGCYNTSFTTPGGSGAFLHQCTGVDKQHLRQGDNYLQYYEPGRIRGGSLSDCSQDGAMPLEYSGVVNSIVRDTGVSLFTKVTLEYSSVAASGLKNGMDLIFNNTTSLYNKTYKIFDVTHSTSTSTCSLVGTNTNDEINISLTGTWIALNTYDPETCCGGVAYGIDNSLKNFSNEQNYHSDFRRVFNNPKNLKQSNRFIENRETVNLNTPVQLRDSGARLDYTYPSVSGELGIVETGVNGVPVFERELPYYGPFNEVDQYDLGERFTQKKNVIKSKNATCYSKSASLEIFPDCVTQFDVHNDCDGAATHAINRVSRLAFVFRGCNFDENCSYDASGRPLGNSADYGGWATHGAPQNLEDLKRGLPGQEINMFINLSTAFGTIGEQCPCPCPPEVAKGFNPPHHLQIPSPVTFPCLPDFDKYPDKYGCNDTRYQLDQYNKYRNFEDFAHEQCDPFPTEPAACNVRQPYTTYGYISHLCGSQTENSKEVIKNSFSNISQSGSYTNLTPDSGVNQEPMYWSFECPNPAPYAPNGASWGLLGFGETGGEQQPYWGLTVGEDTRSLQAEYTEDVRLIAPYYKTESGVTPGCCGAGGVPFADFSKSGTFFDGWPTDNVPFLIEIETSDVCVGCATTNMPTGNLNLTIDGLSAEFYHGDGCTDGDCYGFSNCEYKGVHLSPTWVCSNGFNEDYCENGDEQYKDYGNINTGNTCDCIDGSSFTLSGVFIENSQLPVGWKTFGPNGTSLVEVTSCLDSPNNYLDSDYNSTPSAGVTQFASFKLSCPENIDLLEEPIFPFAFYEGNALANLWSCGGCSHQQPASLGTAGDLSLVAEYFTVPLVHRAMFQTLTLADINQLTGVDGLITWPSVSGVSERIQTCPGDYLLYYGCYGVHPTGGPTTFHGCGLDCTGLEICDTCTGLVNCDECGEITSVVYPGSPPLTVNTQRVPTEYNLGGCGCICKDPTLFSINEVTSVTGPLVFVNEVWRHPEACANTNIYWWGVSGSIASGSAGDRFVGPWVTSPGPPNPYMGIAHGTKTAVDWFSFSHGFNSGVQNINYRIDQPGKDAAICDILTPVSCSTGNCIDPRANSSLCGSPIPNSLGSGNPWIDASVSVRKKACYPEVMIVNKITCSSGTPHSYDLSVSREYHSHDRSWKQRGSEDCPCVLQYAGSYQYINGSDSACVSIPYAVPTDSVTPASDAPCSINPSSGEFVNQDFTFNTKPHASGDTVWSYYNLFYSGNFPNGEFGVNPSGTYISSIFISTNSDDGCGPICGQVDGTLSLSTLFDDGPSLFNSPSGRFGIDATNKRHSCLQDIKECGGDLFCNKMFFPRRPYAQNTKIAPFGSMQICTQNSSLSSSLGLLGYQDFSTTPDILKEAELYRYVDVCDPDIIVDLNNSIDIDDTTLTVSDYLPLMGIIHPGWKYNSNVKSCTILETGDCGGFIPPTYSDILIQAGSHQPLTFTNDGIDSMGYYLDKIGVSGSGANGSHKCLFNPFKILVDVECSTNNIHRQNIDTDDPTLLNFIIDAPSEFCNGYTWPPGCSCPDSACNSNILRPADYCYEYKPISAVYAESTGKIGDNCTGSAEGDICNGDYTVGTILSPDNGSSLFGKYILTNHPDLDPLTPLDVTGFGMGPLQSFECYVPPSSSAPDSGVCQLVSGTDYYRFCDGTVIEVGPSQYQPVWECDDNLYTLGIQDYGSGCCLSLGQTLCAASLSTTKPLDCDSIILDNWTTPPSGFWRDDCGCQIDLGDSVGMTACENDSKLKIIITE